MKKIIWIIALFIPVYTWAQISIKDLGYDKNHIDFGQIIAEDGPVKASYQIVNHGSETFIVSDVEAACGCTKPGISKKILKPGDTAILSAWFDPKGIVGTVTKWIYLKGNFNDDVHLEFNFKADIKTNRIPEFSQEQSYYPGQYGYLLILSTLLEIGTQTQGYQSIYPIEVYNDGSREYSILSVDNLPPYLKALNLPLNIASKEKKSIEFEVNTALIDTVGPLYGTLFVQTNDPFYTKKSLQYSLNLKKDFSAMKRGERRRAPVITFDRMIIDMGQMKGGQLRSKTVNISNKGKSDLLIYRIDTDCTCAVLKDPPRRISPGQTVSTEVQFDALFKSGKQNKGLILYTNDPANPIVTLSVRAEVR